MTFYPETMAASSRRSTRAARTAVSEEVIERAAIAAVDRPAEEPDLPARHRAARVPFEPARRAAIPPSECIQVLSSAELGIDDAAAGDGAVGGIAPDVVIYSIDASVNKAFARRVLTDETFKKVYESPTGAPIPYSGLISIDALPTRVDVRHPHVSPVRDLAYLIGQTGLFRPLRPTCADYDSTAELIRDISVTYRLYSSDTIVTCLEDRLWRLSRDVELILLERTGFGTIGGRRRALNGMRFERADSVKLLLELLSIRNSLPMTPVVELLLVSRKSSCSPDWIPLLNELTGWV